MIKNAKNPKVGVRVVKIKVQEPTKEMMELLGVEVATIEKTDIERRIEAQQQAMQQAAGADMPGASAGAPRQPAPPGGGPSGPGGEGGGGGRPPSAA